MAKSKTRVAEVAFRTLGVLLWKTNLTNDERLGMYVREYDLCVCMCVSTIYVIYVREWQLL